MVIDADLSQNESAEELNFADLQPLSLSEAEEANYGEHDDIMQKEPLENQNEDTVEMSIEKKKRFSSKKETESIS